MNHEDQARARLVKLAKSLHKGSVVYITVMDFPASNNHTRRAKFQIFEAMMDKFKHSKYYDEITFKNAKVLYKMGKFSMNTFSFSGSPSSPWSDISVASPRFGVEDHGEINFVHQNVHQALGNIFRIIFGKKVPENEGTGFFDINWSI
jgi:hypothetical protein